jgi:hypothetical protein
MFIERSVSYRLYSSVQWVTASLSSEQVSGAPFLKVKVTRFLSGTPGARGAESRNDIPAVGCGDAQTT